MSDTLSGAQRQGQRGMLGRPYTRQGGDPVVLWHTDLISIPNGSPEGQVDGRPGSLVQSGSGRLYLHNGAFGDTEGWEMVYPTPYLYVAPNQFVGDHTSVALTIVGGQTVALILPSQSNRSAVVTYPKPPSWTRPGWIKAWLLYSGSNGGAGTYTVEVSAWDYAPGDNIATEPPVSVDALDLPRPPTTNELMVWEEPDQVTPDITGGEVLLSFKINRNDSIPGDLYVLGLFGEYIPT